MRSAQYFPTVFDVPNESPSPPAHPSGLNPAPPDPRLFPHPNRLTDLPPARAVPHETRQRSTPAHSLLHPKPLGHLPPDRARWRYTARAPDELPRENEPPRLSRWGNGWPPYTARSRIAPPRPPLANAHSQWPSPLPWQSRETPPYPQRLTSPSNTPLPAAPPPLPTLKSCPRHPPPTQSPWIHSRPHSSPPRSAPPAAGTASNRPSDLGKPDKSPAIARSDRPPLAHPARAQAEILVA